MSRVHDTCCAILRKRGRATGLRQQSIVADECGFVRRTVLRQAFRNARQVESRWLPRVGRLERRPLDPNMSPKPNRLK